MNHLFLSTVKKKLSGINGLPSLRSWHNVLNMLNRFDLDAEKFQDILLYTLSKCPPDRIGAVKLHKVLYFSDMMSFVQTKAPITGTTYRKRPFGPTTDYLLKALRNLERSGDISISEEDYFGYWKKVYRLERPFGGSNKLSASEIAIVDEMIDFVCYNNSAKTISELSHNRAWELAEMGEEIPYHSVLQIFPQEVSLEAMEWGAGEARSVEAERSSTDPMEYVSLAAFRSRHQSRQH